MELYRKDRLPEVQACFAEALGSNTNTDLTSYTRHQTQSTSSTTFPTHPENTKQNNHHQFNPQDLFGPSGTGGGQIGEDSSPPPFKLAKERRTGSRRKPPPDRETRGDCSAYHHDLRGTIPEGRIRFKEKGSPRAGGGWPGETALNKMGCRGDLSCVNLIPNLDLTKYNTEFRHSSYPTRFSPTSLSSH